MLFGGNLSDSFQELFSVGYSLALPVQPSVSDRFLLSKNMCVALSSLFGVFKCVAMIWFNEASNHIFLIPKLYQFS